MASAFAMMAKRRYETIVARQKDKAAKQKKKTGLQKPPVSSDQTLVWYWDLDETKMTLMFDIHSQEVWCNGQVLRTKAVMPENNIEERSLAFTINTSPGCSFCDTEQQSSYNYRDKVNLQGNSEEYLSPTSSNEESSNCEDTTSQNTSQISVTSENQETKDSIIASPLYTSFESCDCLNCNAGKHKCVIKFIRVTVDKTVYELYVDGCMIQEHTKSPYNYDLWKSQNEKKND